MKLWKFQLKYIENLRFNPILQAWKRVWPWEGHKICCSLCWTSWPNVINAYRSAIASARDRVDRVSVGQHPTISRLMAGVANARPPMPRYTATWDINKVLEHIKRKGDNTQLSNLRKKNSCATFPAIICLASLVGMKLIQLSGLDLRYAISRLCKSADLDDLVKASSIAVFRVRSLSEENLLLSPVESVSESYRRFVRS